MPNPFLYTGSRFKQQISAQNLGCGLAIQMGNGAVSIVKLIYSFRDVTPTPVYNPSANIFQARLAILRGLFADNPQNFTLTYDLSPYDVLLDMDLNSPGPAIFILPPHESADAIRGREGEFVSILLSNGVVTGVAPLMVGKLNGGSEPISAQSTLQQFGNIHPTRLPGLRLNAQGIPVGGGSSGSSGGGGFDGGSGGGTGRGSNQRPGGGGGGPGP